MGWRLVLLTVGLAILTSALMATGAEASFPGKNGRLAFTFFNGSGPELYSSDPDGGNLLRLTNDATWDSEPDFSADGTKITWNKGGEIWIMDADGQNQRRLFSSPYGAADPAFFPDGKRIIFSAWGAPPSFSPALYTIDVDGQDLSRLTGPGVSALNAVVSPSGERIAFTRYGAGPFSQITVIKADGTDPTVIDEGFEPDFAPDGLLISYLGNYNNGNGGVWLSAVDGGSRTRPVLTPEPRTSAIFSPDGTSVAYVSTGRLGCRGFCLWTADLAGENEAPLFEASDWPNSLSWQPIPGPRRSDYKNAAQFCKAEQAFWGDQFASRYGGAANAYGKCVSRS